MALQRGKYWQATALPVFFVLVAVEMQRHWHGPVRWLYLFGAIIVAATWIGALKRQPWARQSAGAVIDTVIFTLLAGGSLLATAGQDFDGVELLGTLVFWTPAICVWWALSHHTQVVRVAIYTALLFAGVAWAYPWVAGRPFHEYALLGVLQIAVIRLATSRTTWPEELLGGQADEADDTLRDPITGVANAACFETELALIAAVANRYRIPFSVVACAIDDYRGYVSHFGEDIGNALLRDCAWKISDRIRTADTLCHWGEGKFVLLLPNTGAENAYRLAEKIREACATLQSADEARVAISQGVAEHCFGEDPMTTFERADSARRQAVASDVAGSIGRSDEGRPDSLAPIDRTVA